MENLLIGNCEPLIGVDAAARLLGVSDKTLKRLAKRKEIPFIRLGKLYKFRASALDLCMRERLESSRHP